jgi:hypothetical protein
MRARDTDRTDTCQLLDSALAEGQLTMDEHRQRVAAATNAATLGELQGLVSDLQPADPSLAVGSRTLTRRRVLAAAAIGGVAVVGIAVAAVMFGGSDAPAPKPNAAPPSPVLHTTAAPDPDDTTADVAPSVLSMPTQLHTLGGLTGLLDQMRTRFGDTMGIELAITADDAMLYRADPTDPHSKLLYRFNGGWGDPTRRPRDDQDDVADLGAFDAKAVAQVLRSAPETLGIAPDDVGDVVVDVDHMADPPPGALELLVKVAKKSGGDGYLYLDNAGNTKRVEYPN